MESETKFKKSSFEKKVYTLLVSSAHGQILHIGTHFTLEEAYSVARTKMQVLFAHNPGESINIEMWNNLDIKEIISSAVDDGKSIIETVIESSRPTEIADMANLSSVSQIKKELPLLEGSDYIREIKNSRNALMKKLIEDGDLEKVEEAKDVLGQNSKRYVLKSIKEKNNSSNESKHV